MLENAASFATQNETAKSEVVAQIARIVRRAGLDYEGWRYVAKQVRKECHLQPAKKGRRLPRILSADNFRRFYEAVDQADDVQHALMLRLLFQTAVRVSELCGILSSSGEWGATIRQCAVRTGGVRRPSRSVPSMVTVNQYCMAT